MNTDSKSTNEVVVWEGEWISDKYKIVLDNSAGDWPRLIYPDGVCQTVHTSRMVLGKALTSIHARAVAAEEKLAKLESMVSEFPRQTIDAADLIKKIKDMCSKALEEMK